jgi:hypothetical protein
MVEFLLHLRLAATDRLHNLSRHQLPEALSREVNGHLDRPFQHPEPPAKLGLRFTRHLTARPRPGRLELRPQFPNQRA